jgi:enterochelin esterase-like enzyme
VRFPVLYLLHSAVGSPDGMIRTQHVQEILRRQIAAGRAHPMLLVFPDGRVPGVTSDSEFANTGLGRYMDAVVETIHAVDRRWSTISDRRARMLAGISTGGYAAANICLHHLPLCGGFESWSGYFVQTRDFPFTNEPVSTLKSNSPASYVERLRAQLNRLPTWGFAYQGTQDHTRSAIVTFMRRFRDAGGHGTHALYPGGHGWGLWRRQLPHMFQWASVHLRAPTAP